MPPKVIIYQDDGTTKLYEGEIGKNGKYDGEGILYNYYGDIEYVGEFKNGLYDGKGIDYLNKLSRDSPDEKRYEGDFKNGLYDGEGKRFDRGSITFKGNFKQGYRDGEGIEYHYPTDKPSFIGHFKNGEYDGEGTRYDINGNITFKGRFRNGRKVGVEMNDEEEEEKEYFTFDKGTYIFNENDCQVKITKEHNGFYLDLFSCISGENKRGKGNGRKLLLSALSYVKENTDNTIQKITLSAVPLDLLGLFNTTNFNVSKEEALKKLIKYYNTLGFTQVPKENPGVMEGKIDDIISKIQRMSGGKKKKTRKYKKSNKRITRFKRATRKF